MKMETKVTINNRSEAEELICKLYSLVQDRKLPKGKLTAKIRICYETDSEDVACDTSAVKAIPEEIVVGEPVEEVASEPAEEVASESAEVLVGEPAEAAEVTETTSEGTAEAAREPTEVVVSEPAEEVVSEPKEKAVKETVEPAVVAIQELETIFNQSATFAEGVNEICKFFKLSPSETLNLKKAIEIGVLAGDYRVSSISKEMIAQEYKIIAAKINISKKITKKLGRNILTFSKLIEFICGHCESVDEVKALGEPKEKEETPETKEAIKEITAILEQADTFEDALNKISDYIKLSEHERIGFISGMMVAIQIDSYKWSDVTKEMLEKDASAKPDSIRVCVLLKIKKRFGKDVISFSKLVEIIFEHYKDFESSNDLPAIDTNSINSTDSSGSTNSTDSSDSTDSTDSTDSSDSTDSTDSSDSSDSTNSTNSEVEGEHRQKKTLLRQIFGSKREKSTLKCITGTPLEEILNSIDKEMSVEEKVEIVLNAMGLQQLEENEQKDIKDIFTIGMQLEEVDFSTVASKIGDKDEILDVQMPITKFVNSYLQKYGKRKVKALDFCVQLQNAIF